MKTTDNQNLKTIETIDILKTYLTANAQTTKGENILLTDEEVSKYYIEFFEFMKNTGYAEYIGFNYLSKIIHKFAVRYKSDISKYYSDSDSDLVLLEAFADKFKGNLFEMIIYRLLSTGRYSGMTHLEFNSWTAGEGDNGSDGYMRYQNTNQVIGVNVKYRLEKEIGDNDKIEKTYLRTREKMDELLRRGEISAEDYIKYSKIEKKVIVFTTTRPAWNMKEDEEPMYSWYTEKELYNELGYKVHNSVAFWDSLYNDLV